MTTSDAGAVIPQESGAASTERRNVASRVGVSWKSVALPSEHGGWSLTAEPALLGLIVVWSRPGFALALAAMVAFVARTPLKLVLVDRSRHRWLARSRLAAEIAAVELVVLVALVAFVSAVGDTRFWIPLAFAAPLVVVELWYDMRSRSRRLVPELAGAIGIGSVACAIALAGGSSMRSAFGLWAVIAARSFGSIPYVRTQIRRTKSKPSAAWHSDLAQVFAVTTATVAWAIGLVPVAPFIAITVLAAINVVAVRLAPRPAVVIGVQQMIFGMAVIATTAIAVLAS